MFFSFELIKHPNIRYRKSLDRLALSELQSMLEAIGVRCEIEIRALGGASFLCFESRALSDRELRWLAGHSSVSLVAEQPEDGLLRPLPVLRRGALEEDLAELLKYKGKTGVPYTKRILNMSRALLALSAETFPPGSLLVADPLCGKGTSLFCALEYGDQAVGLDADRGAIREAQTYFKKYLEFHRLKHKVSLRSETAGKLSLPVWECSFLPAGGEGDQPSPGCLTLAAEDTALLPVLTRKRKADLLFADLPYGIQHAPRAGGKTESFRRLLLRALPAWSKALRPGGVLALSYNTLTLKTSEVSECLTESGFSVVSEGPWQSLPHEVEQAVLRDQIFALNR